MTVNAYPLNYERQFSPSAAIEIAEKTLTLLNLHVQEKIYGQELKTYHCQLTDEKTKSIFFGCGKGLGLQSKASALYEAMEHYVTHSYCHTAGNEAANYFTLNEVTPVEQLIGLNHLAKTLLEKQHEKMPFTCLQEIDRHENLFYPLFMLDPRYATYPPERDRFCYEAHSWLASDSGTASGTSFLEASIHALNELIERDAYSLFLINAFIRKQRHGIRVIDKKTIPDHLQAIVNHIEKTYQDELIIFDITSDLKVPSFFVSMTKQSQLLQPRGCGTSLNREYALERALLESLQPLHIYNEKARKNQQTILANFKETPLLLACAQADVSGLAESGETVHFNTLPGYDKHPSLEQQFHTITQRIKSHGFAVYMQTLASLPTGFTCVRYLIPELERFYMVQTGKYILPAKRGMRLIEQRLD